MPSVTTPFKQDTPLLECITCTRDTPTPVYLHTLGAAGQSTDRTLGIEDECEMRSLKKKNLTIGDYLTKTKTKSDSASEVESMELGTHASKSEKSSHILDFSNASAFTGSVDEIPVATAVDGSNEDESIYEADKYHPNAKTPFYKSRRVMGLTCALLAVISVVISVAVVYSTKNLQKDDHEVVYAPPPTLAPTTERETELPRVIETDVLKRNVTISDLQEGDPRLDALKWILHEDLMQLEANDPKLKQRYTLTLLGIQFDYRAWDYDRTNETFEESFDWLTSADECEWFGVSCSKDGTITGVELCKFLSINDIYPLVT
jgi:hypothetical protein